MIFEHAHYFPEFWFICVLIILLCLSKPAVFIMEELPYLLYRFYNTTLKEKLINLKKDKSLKGKVTPGKWEYPLKNLQFRQKRCK